MSKVTKSSKSDAKLAWRLCFVVMLSAIVIALPDLVYAQTAGTDTPIGNIFCTVVTWFTGNTGKGIATIAVTIIGIGALLGKVSWGMALIVGLGVAIVFGAGGILNALGSGTGIAPTCNTTATWGR